MNFFLLIFASLLFNLNFKNAFTTLNKFNLDNEQINDSENITCSFDTLKVFVQTPLCGYKSDWYFHFMMNKDRVFYPGHLGTYILLLLKYTFNY